MKKSNRLLVLLLPVLALGLLFHQAHLRPLPRTGQSVAGQYQPSGAYREAAKKAKKKNMANPQVIAGGPAVNVNYNTLGTFGPTPRGVFNPAGTQVSTADVNGNGPGVVTATQNGWTLTANPDYHTGSVQAPSSAAPGTGYFAQVGESSGASGVYFDVIVSTAPRTLPTVILGDSLFSDGAVIGPRNGAMQVFGDALFTDNYSPRGITLAPVTSGDTLFTDGLFVNPRTFAVQAFGDALFSDGGGRTGAASPHGTNSAPFRFGDSLFTDGAVFGPRNGAVQSFGDRLFSDSYQRTALSRFLSFSDALFSDGASFGLVSPKINPAATDSRDPFVVMAAELRLLLAASLGNPMTTLSTNLALLDKIAAAYRTNDLNQAANTLSGLPTLIRGGDGVTSTVYGFGQDGPILKILPAAEAVIAASAPNVILAGQYRPIMAAFASFASDLGYASFNAYLSAQNTPTPYRALIHPNAALVNWLFTGQSGTLLLSPGNVFAPLTTFGTANVGTGAGAVAYTNLSSIPAVNVVSPTLGQSTQGYTAAPGVTANITATVNGTLTVTLTANGQNAAGAVVTGRTWTAVLSSAAAGATVTFTPAVAGDRIAAITAASGSGAATAGAFTLNSVLERIVS